MDHKNSTYNIATGFTSAFLGDERTLREFIAGDYVKEKMSSRGENAVLYLINDSYDPLNYRQLRIGVNKDERLLKEFEGYCGRPISEIPDPFECHNSYSQHFVQALLKRLQALDIHPVILDSYQSYQKGCYADFISVIFENHTRILELLAKNFNHYGVKKLFYAQCPKCLCIDATQIKEVAGRLIRFECERCGLDTHQDISDIRGKLSWKLDCAARWNIYDIDMETFSKAHAAELGSFEVSRYISGHFYGGKVPTIIKYGDVKISRELSCKLLEILPPEIIKKLFTSHLTRDLDLNKDFVENFCCNFQVKPGVSFVDYIQRELPKEAIGGESQPGTFIDGKNLVSYGNRFSRFYYNKEYGLRLPDSKTVFSADCVTAEAALSLVDYALSIRSTPSPESKNTEALVKSYLFSQKASPQVYQFLRKVFGQTEGPSMTTLLSILPTEYLNIIQIILAYAIGAHSAKMCNDTEIDQKIHRISELTNSLLEVVHEANKDISPAGVTSHPVLRLPEGG